MSKVNGALNPSDILTKGVNGELLKKHMDAMGWEFHEVAAEGTSAC